MRTYDYIIIGAGASGLMLADALGRDTFFSNKSILLLDKDTKDTDNRTWCFWEKGTGEFDAIVSKKWKHVYFGGQKFSGRYEITPYTYKRVRGIDFYRTYLKRLEKYPNVTFRQESVIEVEDYGNRVLVSTDVDEYFVSKFFNSLFDYNMTTHQDKYPVLRQHFVGWTIKAKSPIFDTDLATYMDFSIPQKGNTRFMYVLPFSRTEALVEYTLFSEHPLPRKEYENAIRSYLKKRYGLNSLEIGQVEKGEPVIKKTYTDKAGVQGIALDAKTRGQNFNTGLTAQSDPDYEIIETEQGSIPMTCYDFMEHHTPNIRYIGTAGGWAKPSTGYTFMSTSKKVPVLIDYLKTGQPLNRLDFKNKFWYYDLLFLDVLFKQNAKGHSVFEAMFKNRSPQLVFKFLDEQTSFWEDLKFISGCPTGPFLKAMFARI